MKFMSLISHLENGYEQMFDNKGGVIWEKF